MRGLPLGFREYLIPFHSRHPVHFRFAVRHLEFLMIQASDNVGNGTGESGVVENRGGVAARISFLCGLELEMLPGGGGNLPPHPYLQFQAT